MDQLPVPKCKTPLVTDMFGKVHDADGNVIVGDSMQNRPGSIAEIVRLVNLHDELVKALRDSLEDMTDGSARQIVETVLVKAEAR